MYKPVAPIRCPKCGTTVNVITSMILTSNPPCYEWICPNCGEKGNTKQGDIIIFENQIGHATSGYIQKIDEADPGVGVTTTNATGDGYNTINVVLSIYSPMTECEICGEEFKYDAKHMHICPKYRKTIVRLQETTDDTANTMPATKSTTNAMPAGNKSTVTDPKSTACDIPAKPFLQQGWQCPKCGAILAPNQSYCPFCSPSEYGRTNWLGPTCGEWINTPPSRQYTNPYPSTTISLGDKPKVPNSCTVTYATPCDNIKAIQ